MIFLSELLSTIGMVLLAGEFVQGKRKWFNKALERLVEGLFPNAILFGYIRMQRYGNKHRLIKDLIRGSGFSVMALIITPVFVLVGATTILSDSLRPSSKLIAYQASQDLQSTDPKRQKLGSEFRGALLKQADCGVELGQWARDDPAIQKWPNDPASLKKDAAPARAMADRLRKCLDMVPTTYDVSILNRVKYMVLNEPTGILVAAMCLTVELLIVFYYLTLSIEMSRLYSRLNHMESFLLPVGFSFAAAGQIIKLGLAVFA